MSRILHRIIVHPHLLSSAAGVLGFVDSMCKIQDRAGSTSMPGLPSQYGNFSSAAAAAGRAGSHLTFDVSGTDLVRPGMWSAGLGYYGWIFYLSKFYEVVDTMIIIAKGRKSSTLQTYHHAGAMLSMWAGIRWMSPPIWIFCWYNSGIHTLMVCTPPSQSPPSPSPRLAHHTHEKLKLTRTSHIVHLLHPLGALHSCPQRNQTLPNVHANHSIPCGWLRSGTLPLYQVPCERGRGVRKVPQWSRTRIGRRHQLLVSGAIDISVCEVLHSELFDWGQDWGKASWRQTEGGRDGGEEYWGGG